MARRDLYDTFLNTAEQCANLADQDGWLMKEIERVIALISASVAEDGHRNPDPERTFEIGIAKLRDFAANRSLYVLPEVADLRTRGPK
jgi:hypothetical protein